MDRDYLSIEQVSSILPEEWEIDTNIKTLNRVIYTTKSGKYLPVASSKISNGHLLYNVLTDYYITLNCEYVCFIVGRLGIIMLPLDVLKRYNKFSGWKRMTLKGKQYWVRGIIKDNFITFTNSNDKDENIQADKYFIPFN